MPPRGVAARGAADLAALLLCLSLCLSLPSGRCDVIFRVPDVQVRHASAPRPVGTGAGTNDSSPWPDKNQALHYEIEEYMVEHEISTRDAKNAAKMLNLDDVLATLPGCGSCSRRDLEYCEYKVLQDHCCCERHFFPEPFPWLPHTCYVGADRCKPYAKDCARYARLRDCCCLKKMAEKWKIILSSCSRPHLDAAAVILLTISLFVVI